MGACSPPLGSCSLRLTLTERFLLPLDASPFDFPFSVISSPLSLLSETSEPPLSPPCPPFLPPHTQPLLASDCFNSCHLLALASPSRAPCARQSLSSARAQLHPSPAPEPLWHPELSCKVLSALGCH